MTKAELIALADEHQQKGLACSRQFFSNPHDDRAITEKAANHFTIANALRAIAEGMNDD